MLEIAFRTNHVLHAGHEKALLPPPVNLGADNTVIGTRAKRQVVTADPLREIVIRRIELGRITSQKFDTSKQRPVEREIFSKLLESFEIGYQGEVANAGFGSVHGMRAVGAIDYWQVKLKPEPLI